ncbi:hypothetical protein JZ751_023504 [Albula glossodonta]|uniref:Uncharacterized protein n=1 Tax=Albula glossodonta TaxID=121402 RepID=A0A8T2NG91_9TELE|nr:hypothetical protein JZ751_023504 [Albula glossodonta]
MTHFMVGLNCIFLNKMQNQVCFFFVRKCSFRMNVIILQVVKCTFLYYFLPFVLSCQLSLSLFYSHAIMCGCMFVCCTFCHKALLQWGETLKYLSH